MSDTTELYMIVERGKESGAYEGLGSLADYVVDGTLQMSISLGEDVSFLFLFFFLRKINILILLFENTC